jgi:hypothetical protein
MRFAAYGGSGFRLARSFALLIPTPASTHIIAVAGTLHVPLSQPQKRRIQPERYATYLADIFTKNKKQSRINSIVEENK